MSVIRYIVLSNALPGRDDEFNDWYTNRHVHDVLKIPGMIAVQRFKLAPVQRVPTPSPYGYLAIYEIEAARAAEVMAALKRDTGSATIPVSPAVAPGFEQLAFEYIPTAGEGRAPE